MSPRRLGGLLLGGLAAGAIWAGARLRLEDGRVLEGVGVRRDGELMLLELEGGSVIPVPLELVAQVELTEEKPPPAASEVPTGLTTAEPQALAGVPAELTKAEPQVLAGVAVTPPRTSEQLAVLGPPSRFQPDIVHTTLEPSYWVPDPDENNWSPVKWADSVIDPSWQPQSAFDPNEDTLAAGRSTFQKGIVDSSWQPTDGFAKPARQ